MRKLFFIIIAIVLYQNSFGQFVFKNSEIYLKNDSLSKGDVQFTDSRPNEILVNKQFINIKLINHLSNDSYELKNIKVNGDEKLLIVIVEGDSMSLYKEKEINLFFVKKNDNIYKLKSGKTLIEKKTGYYHKTIILYKGLLKYLSNGRPELQRETDNLEYTEEDLKLFVIKFNTKTNFVNSENKQKSRYFKDIELFFQYSCIKNNLYYMPNPNTTPGFYELGVRSYIKEGSRSSISTSFQYGINSYENGDYVNIVQINLNYMVDFFRSKNSNLYVTFRLLDATHVWNKNYKNTLNIFPRVNAGFGYRYYIKNKINLFIEVNQLLNLDEIPSNYSIGFSYIL